MLIWLKLSAIFGCLGVILGAFGAHGLKDVLASNFLEAYKTGVFYQFIHSIMIFSVAILGMIQPEKLKINFAKLNLACLFWTLGICLFSGSLYVLSFLPPIFGVITPIGGLMFILGWIRLFWALSSKS
jgi:uncharacterized membrane protein YgdD (TMEM256/DUF423 family)